jgi:hypothetical protein
LIITQVSQLIYVSRAAALEESEQLRMLRQARCCNTKRLITSMLIRIDGFYIQQLEGEAGMVDAVYRTIARDKRHAELTVLVARPARERAFLPWQLGYCEVVWSESAGLVIPRLTAESATHLSSIDVDVADQLLLHARNSCGTGKLIVERKQRAASMSTQALAGRGRRQISSESLLQQHAREIAA